MTVLFVTVSAGRAVIVRTAVVPCSRCDWVAAAHGWFVTSVTEMKNIMNYCNDLIIML